MSDASPVLSLIIPVFSSQRTLFECLESCKTSLQKISQTPTELLIIDDASEDVSPAIAQEFCQENSSLLPHCDILFIQHRENLGPIAARHSGVEASSGKLLFFLDSDVVIGDEVLTKVLSYFNEHEEVAALSGNPQDYSSNSFASRYKSSYMRYILGLWQGSVHFLHGSFFAMRRPVYQRVEETYRGIEDDALGRLLAEQGHLLHILHDLDIRHLKEYTYRELLINDFTVSQSYALLFWDTRGWRDIFSSGFSHAPRGQILSVILAANITALFFAKGMGLTFPEPTLSILLAAALLLWLCLNVLFLSMLRTRHGFGFFCISVIHTFIDHVVMSLGIMSGFLSRLTKS